jgi:hypothetical protein
VRDPSSGASATYAPIVAASIPRIDPIHATV